MDSSRDYIELIKSIFHGPESVETDAKLKLFLSDTFQTSSESYITLLKAVEDALVSNNSLTNTEGFEVAMQHFLSLSTQSKNLATEFIDLKNHERELPANVLPKDQHPGEETSDQINEKRKKELIDQIQAKVSSTLPILQNALNNLHLIDKKGLCEIASYKNPPPSVKFVCELMCTIFNHPKTCMEKRSCIRQNDFISRIMMFDKDSLTQVQVNRVQKKINEYLNFTLENIRKVSIVCASLYIWVTSMLQYYEISKEIKVLKVKLENPDAEARSNDEHKEEAKIHVEGSKKNPEPVHNYEVSSLELSRALAPIIDRENQICKQIGDINKQISEINLVREAIVYGLSS